MSTRCIFFNYFVIVEMIVIFCLLFAKVSRPGGDHAVQMRLYNGKDRVHCLEFQAVSFQDGMIGDLYGPVCGAHHDSYTNNVSLKITFIFTQISVLCLHFFSPGEQNNA